VSLLPTQLDDALRQRIAANLDAFARRSRPHADRRPAAVALVITGDPSGRASFLLTRRTAGLRHHARQWALPGGRIDAGEDAQQAALRELEEELGLRLSPACVLGLLDDYPTRSGYTITPVVVWGGAHQPLAPNPDEVESVYHVNLDDLLAPEVPVLRRIPESDRPVISIPLLGEQIHAPTAAVLFQLREVALWGRHTRVDHYEQPVFAWK
jgi:8-oxo-dGTP pyrophosphatase MutT (NUDIX family)